jgi:fluoride exporter
VIPYLCVAAGGAIGSVGRYWVGLVTDRAWGEPFPWGTILINIVGSFIIGFFSTLTLPSGPLPGSADLRTFIMVGLCGGFTTFSSFSLQTLALMRAGDWVGAMGNVLISVVLCIVAVALGHVLATRIGPEARTGLVLDPQIVAHDVELGRAFPPFAEVALGAVGALHPPAAPHAEPRGPLRKGKLISTVVPIHADDSDGDGGRRPPVANAGPVGRLP